MERREFEQRLGRHELIDRLERRYMRQLAAGDLYGAAETQLAIDRLQEEDDE